MSLKVLFKNTILLLLHSGWVCALTAQDWNSARISVLSATNVEVVVNSFDEIANGVEIPGALTFGVTLANVVNAPATPGLTGFDIVFRTANGIATSIEGSGGNSLDLNTIAISLSNNVGFGVNSAFNGFVMLSQANQMLMSSTVFPCDWTTHKIDAQFDFGTINCLGKLNDQPSDYYTVEIEYTLEPTF